MHWEEGYVHHPVHCSNPAGSSTRIESLCILNYWGSFNVELCGYTMIIHTLKLTNLILNRQTCSAVQFKIIDYNFQVHEVSALRT